MSERINSTGTIITMTMALAAMMPADQLFLFQNEIMCFFGYFDPDNIFQIMKIIDFRGDLPHRSAEKEALPLMLSLP